MATPRGPSRVQPLALRLTAAAEALGDLGYINFTFAADAETELAGRGGAREEEDGGFDAVDADEIVDDAFAILGFRAGEVHVLVGDPGPGEWAVCAEELERAIAEETDLAGRIGEVDVAGDLAGVGAAAR